MTDIKTLVKRLREPKCETYDVGSTGVGTELLDWDALHEAADAIEALQAAQASQSMQLAHDAVTIECLNDKVLALQGEVERLTVERDVNKRMRDLHFAEKNTLQAKLDELQRQEPVGVVELIQDMSTKTPIMHPTMRGHNRLKDGDNLYAAPKALEPLTDEEIERIHQRYGGDMVNCTRAIERHHGITKGTP